MRNRGPDPADHKAFDTRHWPVLTQAIDDLSFLMGRGYGHRSALQMVGNRYRLNKRQRLAVNRVSASAQEVARRREKEVPAGSLKDQPLLIDGFNQLIVMESLFSGAYVFKGRDGAYRDLAGVHGSYKRVVQTRAALVAMGDALESLGCAGCTWFLDRPVSNSGRMCQRLLEIGREHAFPWTVELVYNPDRRISREPGVVISSDSEVLDSAGRWFNFMAWLIQTKTPPQGSVWRVVEL